MQQVSPSFSDEQQSDENGLEDTEKRLAISIPHSIGMVERKPPIETIDANDAAHIFEDEPLERMKTVEPGNTLEDNALESAITLKLPVETSPTPSIEQPTLTSRGHEGGSSTVETSPTPSIEQPTMPLSMLRRTTLPRSRAILLATFLFVLVLNATFMGAAQFIGAQEWAFVLGGPSNTGNANLLKNIANQLHLHPTPGTKGQPTPQITPRQYIDLIVKNMTLDQKLGQMMIVQFSGQNYSANLSAMISQYKVGSVLFFQFNIGSKSQVTELISQMQHNAFLPLAVAVDQEGGTVDRLSNLDGPQPSAASISATGDSNKVYQQGIKDAQNLSYYGFNLNLAPVVDVTNVYNSQLYGRTYGNNPTIVTKMAGAYLKGLQKSGKVLGTLKHFPGLGDVGVDPHVRPPDLIRSLNNLNLIDWTPYRNLIKQGNVYAIMVTHEMVPALDNTNPSSLSPRVIGILRKQMNFQGVIMTDSLTMDSIHNTYTYQEAAAKAVEAGDDLLMGPASPNDVAAMIAGIKQAMSAGEISQQRIDDSVRRILLMKYTMGYLHINV